MRSMSPDPFTCNVWTSTANIFILSYYIQFAIKSFSKYTKSRNRSSDINVDFLLGGGGGREEAQDVLVPRCWYDNSFLGSPYLVVYNAHQVLYP